MSDTSPTDLSSLRDPATRIWLITFGLFAVGCVVVGTLVPGPDPNRAYCLGLALGIIFAGISITCVCVSWANLPHRIPIAIFFHFALMVAFSAYVTRTGGPGTFVFIGCVTLLLLSLITQIPLWTLRTKSGYRFISEDEAEVREDSKPQFSIANVLMITTVLAVVMAMGRTLLPYLESRSGGSPRTFEWVLLFALTGIGSVIITLAGLWYMASRKRLTLIGGVSIWIGVIGAQVFQLTSLTGLYDSALFGISIHLTMGAIVWATFIALYRSGQRIRVGKHES